MSLNLPEAFIVGIMCFFSVRCMRFPFSSNKFSIPGDLVMKGKGENAPSLISQTSRYVSLLLYSRGLVYIRSWKNRLRFCHPPNQITPQIIKIHLASRNCENYSLNSQDFCICSVLSSAYICLHIWTSHCLVWFMVRANPHHNNCYSRTSF